ncbi:MAG: (2Fe-2S)-binding protein [Ilumatobacter sp.]|uniref:(2Fe-2S)-binding protein n=1 Tax=Ilumatobacter sp. TaxID=1967498 RepID=UPI003299ED31
MVVCHCELVNDRTIREIAVGDVVTVAQVTERCGAGGHCGGCHESIERLLDAAAAVRSASVDAITPVRVVARVAA